MQATAILSFVRRFVSGNPIRWLVLGGSLLIAAITIGTTIMAGNFRERALSSAERELENTVLLLARHFDQQLSDFIGLQGDVATQIGAAGITSPAKFKARMSTFEMHEDLKAKVGGHSDVAGINVFDFRRNVDQFVGGLAASQHQNRRPSLLQGRAIGSHGIAGFD